MAFNGSGVFSVLKTLVAGNTITAAEHNAEWANIKGGLELARLRDGQNNPSADLPMSTFRHTGVNDATARTNYASAADVQDSQLTYVADTGAADAYAITLAPAITAYAAGQQFTFKAVNANTGASTLNVNSLGAKNILKNNDVALASGDIEASQIVTVVYDGTSFQMTSHTGNAISDATLTSIAALGTAADKMLYTTGVDTWAEAAITSAGRALLDDAAASNQRTTLGLAIGTNVQAWDVVLDDIAGLTLAQGDVLYYDGSNIVNLGAGTDGQFLKTQGAAANPTWSNTITAAAVQATTSGTAVTFGSIPSWAKRIIIMINGVSFTTANALDLTLGDSGGLKTSGYEGGSMIVNASSAASFQEATAAFELTSANDAATAYHGTCTLDLLNPSTNTWTATWNTFDTTVSPGRAIAGAGRKALTGTLTQVQLSGGTFDAGEANIQYLG